MLDVREMEAPGGMDRFAIRLLLIGRQLAFGSG